MITLTFTAGSLPPNFCPATWQITFQAFVNALSATVNGLDNTQILVSPSAPAISSSYLWLQVSGGGVPLQLYSANGGVWVPIQPTFFFPGLTDIGAANSYQVTGVTIPVSVNPDGSPATGLVTGMTFVFLASHSNTAASTFQVNAYTLQTLLVGVTATTAGQIVAGNWYVVLYDGTHFQLLNPSFGYLLTTKFQSGLLAVPTAGNNTSIAHTLGKIPSFCDVWFQCLNPNNGWVAGDIVSPDAFARDDGGGAASVSGTPAFYWVPTTANFTLFQKNCAGTLFKVIIRGGDYAAGATMETDWQFYVSMGYVP